MKNEIVDTPAMLLINNKQIAEDADPKEIISIIAQCALRPDLIYWSIDALTEMRMGILEAIKTFVLLQIEEKTGDTKEYIKCLKRIDSQIDYILDCMKLDKEPNKGELVQFFYDLVLKNEGLDGLRGFGSANKFGDAQIGNPEKELCELFV